MKRFLAILVTSAMVLGMLAGCGSQSGSSSSQSTAGTSSASSSGSAKSGGQKIAIVTSPTGVNDGSFNENVYDGILSFIKDNSDSTVTPVQESTGDATACVKVVSDIVADYDTIICDGTEFAGIGTIAKDNPDVNFILVDQPPTDESGNSVSLSNVYSMTFKEQECGFPVGIAAALASKTGKVASIGGIAYPSNVNYQYGFMSGVNYANKHYGTNVECVQLSSYAGTDIKGNAVGGNYIGSFSDADTGKVVANALIDAGCDVLFTFSGGASAGVFTAAKEAKGVYCIGSDVDQYDDGVNGSENVILTSALKIMDKNVEKQLNNIKSGTFKGENAVLGADTDSTGYVSESGRCQLTDDEIKKIDEAFSKVKDGSIVPAASTTNTTPDNYPGL